MNNNQIPNTTANKLYVAHSSVKENTPKESLKRSEPVKVSASKASNVQFINRSYYYDSNGGGYQGL